MTQESVSQEHIDADEQLANLIHGKMSSIDLLAECLNLEKEAVLEGIARLLEKRVIHGRISSDGSRFFRSDVKLPTGPGQSAECSAAIDELISTLPVNSVNTPKCNKGYIGRKYMTT